MSSNSAREASHAGSWYESDGSYLHQQLSNWLTEATNNSTNRLKARAIIAPHAGYTYSGPTAAYAYRHIDPTDIERVFLLGPSHHYSLNTCALTNHCYIKRHCIILKSIHKSPMNSIKQVFLRL